MANVLNRTTKQYLRSVNTPDYPVVDWIVNPDLADVIGWDSKYWIITGDVVTLMTPAERSALDTAELESLRDQAVAQLDQLEDILRAFAGVVKDEINILRQQFNSTTAETNQLSDTNFSDRTLLQLRAAIRNKLGT